MQVMAVSVLLLASAVAAVAPCPAQEAHAKQEVGSREPEVGMKHARLRLRSERDANGLVTLCLARVRFGSRTRGSLALNRREETGLTGA